MHYLLLFINENMLINMNKYQIINQLNKLILNSIAYFII